MYCYLSAVLKRTALVQQCFRDTKAFLGRFSLSMGLLGDMFISGLHMGRLLYK